MAHHRTHIFRLLAGFVLLLVVVAGCSPAEPLPDPVTLTVTVAGDGVGTVISVPAGIDVTSGDDPDTLTVGTGTEVILTAAAQAGSTFAGWTGDCTGTDTCVLPMDGNAAVTATFTLDPDADTATLTVTIDGTGVGTVTSVPAGIDVTSGDDPDTLTVDTDTEVTLTADAEAGSTFVGWTGDCTGTDTCVLPMDSDAQVTATFNIIVDPAEPQTLSVSKAGAGDGGVTSEPGGIALAVGQDSTSADFDGGIEVTLTAVPTADSLFAGWSGDCTGLDPCVVTMDAPKNVTARFALASEVTTTAFEILATSDDAEQYKGVTPYGPIGSVDIGSSRLDLGSTTATLDVKTLVGLRFASVSVPQGAVITSATITFRRESQTGTEPVTFTITGHDADNAGTFVAANTPADSNLFGISSREATSASVLWPNESAWGTTAATPNLAGIVQEIVNRGGWSEGNALAFIIDSDDPNVSPSNSRGAQAFGSGTPPILSISFYVPPAP
jgi:hypothetical protein